MSEAELDVESVDYESEARSQGWRPQEEWKGDPDKWKSAERFVKDGENILPLVQSKKRALEEQVAELAGRVEQLTDSNRQFQEFSHKALEKEKRDRKRAEQELRDIRKKAIAEGDGETFEEVDRQIAELQSQDQPSTQPPPGANEFLRDNPWYGKDSEMSTYADALGPRLNGEGYYERAYFDELAKRVKQAFPHKFDKPKAPSVEADGTKEPSGKKGRSFDDLPREAQKMCERFVKDIPGYTKDQYLETYEWE